MTFALWGKFLLPLLPPGSRPVKILEDRAGRQTRPGVMSSPSRSVARTNRIKGEVLEAGSDGVPIAFEGMTARMLQLATCSPRHGPFNRNRRWETPV